MVGQRTPTGYIPYRKLSMPQAASIVVNDRETTPVAHTFAPRSVAPGSATFVEANSVPIGEKQLIIRSQKKGSRYHSRITLSVPTLVTETINGVSVPKVPRTAFVAIDFRFDDTSSLQERKNAVGMIANALAASNTVVDGAVTGLEGIW